MTDTTDVGRLDCGKTIEELADYVAEGRSPRDSHIESCPECANVIDALERVSQLSAHLIHAEALALEPSADSWIDRFLTDIQLEVLAGRSHVLPHPDPRVQLSVTENAVKSHLRAVADNHRDIILGRCEIEGELGSPETPVTFHVTLSVAARTPVHAAAERLRRTISSAVHHHTGHPNVIVDITVVDVHTVRTP